MPPAEAATSSLTSESHALPEPENMFLTCLVNPNLSWTQAGPGLGGPAKDTGFLSVGHSGCGAPNDVAVEGDF